LILRRLGYDVIRYEEKFEHPFDLLDLVLRDYLSKNEDFYFVQIGASNGIRGDQLYPLICQFHLKGLLVEPLPDQFEELKQNYADHPQLVFENCAIAEENGHRSMFRFVRNAAVPDWAYGLASFDRTHLTKFKDVEHLGKYVEEIQVPTMTYARLIDKHGIDHISLLHVDTEGYDFEILKMALEEDIYPEIINFEHEHLSAKDNLECKQRLLKNNYLFVKYGRDILAIHNT
jgi:FkbM family methyltransferase